MNGDPITMTKAALVALLDRRDARIAALESELDAKHAKLVEVADKLAEERAMTDALVAALPKCDQCPSPATKALRRGGARWCDEHGARNTDYPRAAPLRAILAARKATK